VIFHINSRKVRVYLVFVMLSNPDVTALYRMGAALCSTMVVAWRRTTPFWMT
jgi:hypothetical protein